MKRTLCGIAALALLGASGPLRAEPGVTADSIVIGQSIGVSGPVKAVAEDIVHGLEAAFGQINEGGGIGGRRLELRTLDDRFDPAASADNGPALAEQSLLLAATLGTPHTAALAKATDGSGMPILCPFTGADSLRSGQPRLFHLRASYRSEVFAMVRQLSSIGLRSLGLFYQQDSFGEAGRASLRDALAAQGLQIAAEASYARGSLDVDAAVETFRKSPPQAIILFAVTRPAAEFVRRMRAAGVFTEFYTISTNANGAFVAALGDERRGVVNTQVMPSPTNTALPIVRDYREAMDAKGYSADTTVGLEGYICGRLIGAALQRSGSTPSRARVVDALESMHEFDLGGFRIDFSARDHEASELVDISIIDGHGRFVR